MIKTLTKPIRRKIQMKLRNKRSYQPNNNQLNNNNINNTVTTDDASDDRADSTFSGSRNDYRDNDSLTKREEKREEDINMELCPVLDFIDLSTKTVRLRDLQRLNAEKVIKVGSFLCIENAINLHKQDLVHLILQKSSTLGYSIIGEGVLEILQDGYGFLRSVESNYVPGLTDIYISPNQVRKYSLRTGDTLTGCVRSPVKGERYFAMVNTMTINGEHPTKNKNRIYFEDLTPLFPNKQIVLEDGRGDADGSLSKRIIDIASPLGMGQRALVVAPPKTGKTRLIYDTASAIIKNCPDIILIVLLIDERPEEVTELSRFVGTGGEVVSSTFDEPSTRHVQLAEIVIEKAKRLVECKKDVVILLDSITRLARAYNNVVPSSGKVLSGGVDSNALHKPKRFFGAARNIEEGGSLTIIATALVDTGSRMDEVIFEEFKGTGNCEIVLDRKIADRRTFPAMDITKSGTRKEELLLEKTILPKMWILRKILQPMGSIEAMEFLISKLGNTKSNDEFFSQMDTYNPSNKAGKS